MPQIALRQEILDTISSDAILYGKVADALKIKPISLPYLLNNNSMKLTQISVLNVLREHLKIKLDSDLLQELEVAA